MHDDLARDVLHELIVTKGTPRMKRQLRFGIDIFSKHADKFDGEPTHISKAAFDALHAAGEFAVGPFKSSFGDGYGEPYNPYRQAAGITTDRRLVFCELHPDRRKEPRDA